MFRVGFHFDRLNACIADKFGGTKHGGFSVISTRVAYFNGVKLIFTLISYWLT